MCDQPLTQADLRSLAQAAPERLTVEWVRLPGTEIEVTAQPVRLDGLDGPIVPVSARTAQVFADMLCGYPTTAAIEDAIWTEAEAAMPPYCLPNDGSWQQAMTWWAHADAWLSQQRAGAKTLVSFGDKSWVLDNGTPAGMASNYGMHVPTSECSRVLTWRGLTTYQAVEQHDARVVQPLASAHNLDHADYSQHCRLWRPILNQELPREDRDAIALRSYLYHESAALRSLRLCQ